MDLSNVHFHKVFANEHTEDLCNIIQLSQKTNEPIVVVFAHRLAAIESSLNSVVTQTQLGPRTQESLKAVAPESKQLELEKKFHLAIKGVPSLHVMLQHHHCSNEGEISEICEGSGGCH